jgi:hypothetical protein
MIAFLALLFVLLVIYAMTKTKEGFNPMNTSPEHRINIPVNEIPAMLAPASSTAAVKEAIGNTVSTPASNGSIFPECDVKSSAWPGMLPGPLPTAPYEQIAVGSPLPYQDTTLIKANRQQLINLLEMIKGFLAFEAQEISERSDPTIQLPLQTARTDFHVLQAEVQVLNRNPGIQPNITLSHLNEISSNLAFLQSEVRLIGSAGPIQGPIYEFTKPVEGFYGDSSDAKAKRSSKMRERTQKASEGSNDSETRLQEQSPPKSDGMRSETGSNARNSPPQEEKMDKSETAIMRQSQQEAQERASQLQKVAPGNAYGEQGNPPPPSAVSQQASVNASTSSSTNATLQDLKDFILRINCESVRLSASGTSDPNVKARIVALANIKSDITSIIKGVEMDPTTESDIPVTKADLNKALPTLGKIGTPIPELINKMGLPPALASLFPPNVTNDPLVTKQIGNMADKYLDTFLNGLSWQVKYTSPREAQAGCGTRSEQFMNAFAEKKRKSASTIDISGFPSFADLDNASNAKFTPMDSGLLITDRYAPLPSDAGRGPSRFDWKARSKEIEGQVKKRGLKPDDFGIMSPKSRVSSDFSWRGYARMICTRLLATTDPNLPVACGCPPMDWPGWRNAQ